MAADARTATRESSPPGSRPAGALPARRADDPFHLMPFDRLYAPLIAGWVTSDHELTWLAPGTTPPLTAAKIAGWGTKTATRFLYRQTGADLPIGYAELDYMPGRRDQMWIGHLVVDPACRGQSNGLGLVRALLDTAFDALDAGRVLLVVLPDNHAAIRCYERAGMMTTGSEQRTFRNPRRTHTFLRMEIDREQYRAGLADP